ncbi:hypothetical protein ACTVLL_11280 [Serratia nevei]|uniref:hypothetical protein n=1 Tax=Serratia nevei TaxID=2703794 RepID=UPI003FA68485
MDNRLSELNNAFDNHIKNSGLNDDSVVTIRECRAALAHVIEQQPVFSSLDGVREFSAEMLARADDSNNSLSDDVRAGMRTAAAFANMFIDLSEAPHG